MGADRFPVIRSRSLALPPDANAEVFMREVDDEVRRDQLTAFWTRWGKLLIAAIVVGLALFAAYLFWQSRRDEAAGVQGEQLQAAYDSVAAGDYAKAEAPLKQLAAEGGRPTRRWPNIPRPTCCSRRTTPRARRRSLPRSSRTTRSLSRSATWRWCARPRSSSTACNPRWWSSGCGRWRCRAILAGQRRRDDGGGADPPGPDAAGRPALRADRRG